MESRTRGKTNESIYTRDLRQFSFYKHVSEATTSEGFNKLRRSISDTVKEIVGKDCSVSVRTFLNGTIRTTITFSSSKRSPDCLLAILGFIVDSVLTHRAQKPEFKELAVSYYSTYCRGNFREIKNLIQTLNAEVS